MCSINVQSQIKKVTFSVLIFIVAFLNIVNAQNKFGKGYRLADSTSLFFTRVLQTSDSGLLLIGQNHDGNNFSYAFIIKTTLTGDTVWTRILKDITISTRIFPQCGAELSNGQGYLIAGYSIISVNVVNAFAFVIDTSGNLIWSKEYFYPAITADYFLSCTLSLDGNILLSGYIQGAAIGSNYLLMKISANGNIIWSQGLQSVYNNSTVHNNKIIQLSDSSIIVCGSTQLYIVNNIQYVRTFIGKFSQDGTFLWAKTYGDSLTITEPNAISYDNNNHLLVSGRHTLITTGQPPTIGYLMLLDTAGNILWYNEYDNFVNNNINGTLNARILTSGEIVALKRNHTNGGLQIFKTDSSGFPIWNKFIIPSFSSTLFVQDFTTTFDGGFVICGGLYDGTGNALLLKTDSSAFINCFTVDTIINFNQLAIPFQDINPLVVALPMNDSSVTYLELSGVIQSDICIGTGISDANSNIETFSIYPNPTDKIINVFLKKKGIVTISNLLGDILFEKYINTEGNIKIDVSLLSSGIYFVKINNEVRKFVKE